MLTTIRGVWQAQPFELTLADGEVSGNPAALLVLLRDAQVLGTQAPVTPTGPLVPVSVEDPASVVCWLGTLAAVTSVEGDLPAPQLEDLPDDAIA